MEHFDTPEYKETLVRYADFFQRIGAKGDASKSFKALAARYSERHRTYHNLSHINAMLDDLEQVRYLAQNPDVVEGAVWYHDVVYDPKAKDNEEQSAALAVTTLKEAGLADIFYDVVNKLIMATKHSEISTDPDAQLLADIDLAILGKSDHTFDMYERAIRKEYEW